ncbi:hypothetical protein, partial [Kiloniella litopenaei]|uniref:hypothetical protein n=1 Tax=Kiloniella litopenaei TaxID=1549748 RepID=UPI00194E4594
ANCEDFVSSLARCIAGFLLCNTLGGDNQTQAESDLCPWGDNYMLSPSKPAVDLDAAENPS